MLPDPRLQSCERSSISQERPHLRRHIEESSTVATAGANCAGGVESRRRRPGSWAVDSQCQMWLSEGADVPFEVRPSMPSVASTAPLLTRRCCSRPIRLGGATSRSPCCLVMTLLGASEPAACRSSVWIRIQSCPVVSSASGGKATKPCAGPPLTIEDWPTTTPPELTPKANVVNATVCIGAPAQPSSFSHVKSS